MSSCYSLAAVFGGGIGSFKEYTLGFRCPSCLCALRLQGEIILIVSFETEFVPFNYKIYQIQSAVWPDKKALPTGTLYVPGQLFHLHLLPIAPGDDYHSAEPCLSLFDFTGMDCRFAAGGEILSRSYVGVWMFPVDSGWQINRFCTLENAVTMVQTCLCGLPFHKSYGLSSCSLVAPHPGWGKWQVSKGRLIYGTNCLFCLLFCLYPAELRWSSTKTDLFDYALSTSSRHITSYLSLYKFTS